MSATAAKTDAGLSPQVEGTVINDVVIEIATANGTGSQSANLILMRAIFYMGIPVSGKNLFPSNIQGLPTWFNIRANGEGWVARRPHPDFLIAMNPETAEADIEALQPGACLILRESLKGFVKRDDLIVCECPFDKIVAGIVKGLLRKKVVNVLYVGIIAHLLGIDVDAVEKSIDWQFGTKKKAADLNKTAFRESLEWARENIPAQEKFRLRQSDANEGKIIIEGNEANAIGAVFGGATVLGWYPITPSSSVCEYAIDYFDKYRRDPETNKATYAVVQAEDELASMAMVVGAGWAGARSFTATSGPGISLMAELAGLSYFAEIPAVIIDVQRMGPSTGLPTRTCQGDISKAYYLSHGDCKHVLLLPGCVAENYEFTMEALNLAEQLQTLVFVMSDLDLGMNYWVTDAFKPPTRPIERGKIVTAEDLENGVEFARYRDVDGDGVCHRTLPGTPHPAAAYFTRGTGHTDTATYSEKPDDWKNNMDRLVHKFETARSKVPAAVIETSEGGADIGIIAYGSSDLAVREARHILARDHDLKTDYLRLRALPFGAEVDQFIRGHRVIYLVEQNRDAQVAGIIRAERPEFATKIKSVLHYDGMPIDAGVILTRLLEDGSRENGSQ